jgi:glycerol-3-phosphate O-acyltransferase/dihydroxyacetone phosphate acyltransferase
VAIRTKLPPTATAAQRVLYDPIRRIIYFLLEYLPYAPIRRFNKPSLHEPYIWASSHSNYLCDCVPAGLEGDRPTRFLAKSTLFRFPIKTFIEFCGALPITRPEDVRHAPAGEGENRSQANRATFKVAISAMEKGWPVAVFPEGTSLARPGLILPLKVGIAKLAFAAEEANEFQLGLRIIPVGLEYVGRLRVGSGLNIRYGTPLLISDYRAVYEKAKEEGYRAVMADLTREMIRVYPHFQDEAKQTLGRKLTTLGLFKWRYDAAQLFLKMEKNEAFWAGLNECMATFEEANRDHRIPLPAWGHRRAWKELGPARRRKRAAFLFAWAPLSILDFFTNSFPEFCLVGAVERIAVDETEKMSLRFGLAPLVLPLAYALQFWLARWAVRGHFDVSWKWLPLYMLASAVLWYGTVHWKKQFKRMVSLLFFRKEGIDGASEVVGYYRKLRHYCQEFQNHGG